MNIETEILNSVFIQLNFNDKKNIFYCNSENEFLTLAESTVDFINDRNNEILNYFNSIFNAHKEQNLINTIVNKVLLSFYKSNQFIDFSPEDIQKLKSFYIDLILEIVAYLEGNSADDLKPIIQKHYNNLRFWISQTNPFIKVINQNRPYVVDVVCSEYSPEMQLSVLELDLISLMQPLIDIGCGYNANLVKYLRSKGISAFGLDRIINSKEDFFENTDWMSYFFFPDKWGTIIAHMSFSNHFLHHHYRNDGHFSEYALKYSQIINSLIVGGRFIYSPSLPFIEEFLESDKYFVEKKEIQEMNNSGKELGFTTIKRNF